MDTYIGFDSAWANNRKARGAICAVKMEDGRPTTFEPPELASFAEALDFIKRVRSTTGVTLVALDQPTIVPNATGMRPVERLVASPISWMGGGVQPSNTGKTGLFCKAAPIWHFLSELNAVEDPKRAQSASDGLFLMEVFPAIALASLNLEFFCRLGGPRYNPKQKKTFQLESWVKVARTAADVARKLSCEELAAWCCRSGTNPKPHKADQDRMDSVLCVLIALLWRRGPREETLMVGDMQTGYMVLPASQPVRQCLTNRARKLQVKIDGSDP